MSPELFDDLPEITQPVGAEPDLFQVYGAPKPLFFPDYGVWGRGGTGQELGPQVRHVPGAWTDSWPNSNEQAGGSGVAAPKCGWEAWIGVRV